MRKIAEMRQEQGKHSENDPRYYAPVWQTKGTCGLQELARLRRATPIIEVRV